MEKKIPAGKLPAALLQAFLEKYGRGELPDPEKILAEVKKLH